MNDDPPSLLENGDPAYWRVAEVELDPNHDAEAPLITLIRIADDTQIPTCWLLDAGDAETLGESLQRVARRAIKTATDAAVKEAKKASDRRR